MTDFSPIPNRDAFAAILGFRYQADWTIIRWCELNEGEQLVLECGEDIDIVASALSEATKGNERQLQQIKYSQKSISLRSRECLESVANFVHHRSTNPDLNLRFCFCTNSRITTERPSPFRRRIPGISVWESLRDVTREDAESFDRITELRRFLQGCKKPAGYGPEMWKPFQKFLNTSSEADFRDFIRRFEWRVGLQTPETLVSTVRLQLVTAGLASSEQDSATLHALLFYHVIHILSQAGAKRLDRDLLESHAKARQPADSKALHFISSVVFGLEQRLADLERLALSTQMTVATVNRRIDDIAKQSGASAIIDAAEDQLSLFPPPQVQFLARRSKLVGELIKKLRAGSTLALRGTYGAGKSQLALLIRDSLESHVFWLSLRECDEADAIRRICLLLEKIADVKDDTDFPRLVASAFTKVRKGTILGIEDVPRMSGDSSLTKLFKELVRAAFTAEVRLLITTHYSLPDSLKSDSHTTVTDFRVPMFNGGDIQDVLCAFGAPTELVSDSTATLLGAMTLAHPMLLVAAIRRLKAVDWDVQQLNFQGIIAGQSALAISSEAVQKVLDTVESSHARELLYRLAIIRGVFDAETLVAVANADPTLSGPLESAQRLDGLWLEKVSENSHAVSPLIRPLAEIELAESTKKNVFRILGDGISHRSKISVYDVANAVYYFGRADNLNRAALFLLFVLDSAKQLPKNDLRYLLHLAWGTGRCPDSIQVSVKLLLRARQVSLFRRVGLVPIPADILDECEELVRHAENADLLAAYCYLVMSVFEVATFDFPRSCRQMEKLLSICSQHQDMLPALPVAPGQMLWMNVVGVTKPADLDAWLNLISSLSVDQLKGVFEWRDAERGCRVVVDSPWLAAHKRNTSVTEWRELEAVYERAATIGDSLGIQLIWTCAIRSRVTILSDYLKDFEAAVGLANAALDRRDLTKSNRYLLNEIIGRQYVYQKMPEPAKHHLIAALDDGEQFYPELRCWSHLELASVYGDTEAALAQQEALRGVETARNHPIEVDDAHLIRTLGELAIASWRNGDKLNCFVALDEATRRTLDGPLIGDEADALLPRVGHCAVYFSTIAATGEPPISGAVGEKFVEPPRRFFLGESESVADWYRTTKQKDHHPSLCASLSVFADVVGRDDLISEWALRGMDEARAAGNMVLIGILAQRVVPGLLKASDYPVTLDVIRECGANMRATKVLMDRGEDPTQLGQSADSIIQQEDEAVGREAERFAIHVGIVPLFLHLGLTAIHDRTNAIQNTVQVIEAIEAIVESTYYPDAWRYVVEMLQRAFIDGGDWKAMKDEAERWGQNGCYEMQTIGYLAASITPDAPLEYAAIGHVVVMWYVEKQIAPVSQSVRRQLAEPFVVDFWTTAFRQQRFRFAAPAVFERDIEDAQSPTEDRLVKVLKAAIAGTGAQQRLLPAYAKDWLYGN